MNQRPFKNTDIVSFRPSEVLSLTSTTGNWIIYVETCEDRLFFEVVLPMAKLRAEGRRLVICDLDSNFAFSTDDCPLVLLDAGKIGVNDLRRFQRLEKPANLCEYVRSRQGPIIIHLRRIGNAMENLSSQLTGVLDHSDSTLVILTGVHGEPGIRNSIHPGITSRCAVCAVEW